VTRRDALLGSPFVRHVRLVAGWAGILLTALLPVLYVVVLAVWWSR